MYLFIYFKNTHILSFINPTNYKFLSFKKKKKNSCYPSLLRRMALAASLAHSVFQKLSSSFHGEALPYPSNSTLFVGAPFTFSRSTLRGLSFSYLFAAFFFFFLFLSRKQLKRLWLNFQILNGRFHWELWMKKYEVGVCGILAILVYHASHLLMEFRWTWFSIKEQFFCDGFFAYRKAVNL